MTLPFKLIDNQYYKSYSILIPLIQKEEEIYVLFEKRAITLKTQPGEICFPGGKIEDDESPIEAAIRECCEELLIRKSDIQILGEVGTIISPFNQIIYGYFGLIENYQKTFNPSEVDKIHLVKLTTLLKMTPKIVINTIINKASEEFPHHMIEKDQDIKLKNGKYPVYFYELPELVIWGLTAKHLYNALPMIKEYYENTQ